MSQGERKLSQHGSRLKQTTDTSKGNDKNINQIFDMEGQCCIGSQMNAIGDFQQTGADAKYQIIF